MATAHARWLREELVIRHPDSMARETAQAIVLAVARLGLPPERPRGVRSSFRPFLPRLWFTHYVGAQGSCVLALVGDVFQIGWYVPPDT